MKYSNHQTKYIGKQVRLRTYQQPCTKQSDTNTECIFNLWSQHSNCIESSTAYKACLQQQFSLYFVYNCTYLTS